MVLDAIIGLGRNSMRKSYYPELRRRLGELERFRALFDAGSDLILLVALPEGRIVDANRPTLHLLGWERDGFVGRRIGDILSGSDLRHVFSARDEVEAAPVRMALRRADGTPVPVDVTARFARFDERLFALLVARDISERLRLESELRRAKEVAEQADRAKSRFLAAASHDLRQPAQAMMSFAEVIHEHVADPGRQAFGHFHRSLQALGDMLNELLDISRLDAGIVTPNVVDFAISELLERIVGEYGAAAEQNEVRLRHVPSAARVSSDPILLGRMFQNLIGNAVKYAPAGRVVIGCRRRGAMLSIEIWDTGIGIPEGQLTEIFEEYVQLGNPERDRRKGLGLGLAIVSRLARMLGHHVTVASVPGKGSVFAVEVPLAAGGRPSYSAAAVSRTRSIRAPQAESFSSRRS